MSLNTSRLFLVTIIGVVIKWVNTYSYYCDISNTGMVNEGNLGQSELFPWLGVLKVYLYKGEIAPDIAATGLVLVKKQFALVNAHDVSRMPLNMLKLNGRIEFFPSENGLWTCKPKSYIAHPEYGPITLNTVALLELDLLTNKDDFTIKPICWTSEPLNASTYLYATGYTDENRILEKMLFKLQYTENASCSEFYNRAKLGDRKREPVYYICGHSTSSKTHCVWDNGMVLMSNATQYFTLLGFGIRGPGCAAPARFINLQYYYDWMQEVTTERDQYDEYRRAGGFEEVPLHELFKPQLRTSDDRNKQSSNAMQSGAMSNFYNPFTAETPSYFNIAVGDNGSISVFPFNNSWESFDQACNSRKSLIYREFFELNAEGGSGTAVYKISLYDLLINKCTCIKINMGPTTNSSAILSIMEQIEGVATRFSEGMIPNLFKDYPYQELYTDPEQNSNKRNLQDFFKAAQLKELFGTNNYTNYYLYIQFAVKDKTVMQIEMYGEPYERSDETTTEEAALNKTEPITFRAEDEENKLTFKSGFVQNFSNSKSLYGVIKPKYWSTTTVKRTTAFKYLRPLDPISKNSFPLKPNGFTRLWDPAAFRPTLSPTTRKPSSPGLEIKSGQHKYDKVQMYTRVYYTTSTPYPSARVESLSVFAGSPRSSGMFQVTLAKVLCFDLLMLLINS